MYVSSFCVLFLFVLAPSTSSPVRPPSTSSSSLPGNSSDDPSREMHPASKSSGSPIAVSAFRIENGWNEMEEGVLYVYSDEPFQLRLVGQNLSHLPLSLTFTNKPGAKGDPCDDLRSTGIFASTTNEETTALFNVDLTLLPEPAYFCLRRENSTAGARSQFFHQGTDRWMVIATKARPIKTYILPLWLQIIVIIILLLFSGLFSGLNLGLMSLDQTELNIMIASGTAREKRYAKTIMPLRKRGNFLLCTILLGNVLVNNCLTILLDDLTGSGWMAIAGATLAIVIFGEIIPQAVCSRYGLAVGARTIWFTKFFMVITFPLSFPISLLLDHILGEEIGYVYNRDRLRELLKLTEKHMGLVTDEVNIITGALELSKKNVSDIMTKISDVFMIEYASVLDFETVTKIMDSGYTRIPVFEKERSNVVALLNTKDLAFVDPDDRIPLNTITKFYNHPVQFVFEDVKLDVILQDFKKGGSHMAMVQSVVSDGPGDPFYQVVGLVTLEDVIEEIIQSEIYDEFDTVMDNKNRLPRTTRQKDYSLFNLPSHHNQPRLTPQLQLATFQFLSASLTPFRPPHMSERILHKLMSQNVVVEHKHHPSDPPFCLYQHGKYSDFFVLIVQGRVEVQCGKEHLSYETGCFAHFGLQALLVKSGRHFSMSQADSGSLYRSNQNIANEPRVSNNLSSSVNYQQKHQLQQKQSNAQSTQVSSARQVLNLSNGGDLKLVPANGPFVSDFTVCATSDLQLIKISREQYLVAWRASQLEQELHRSSKMADAVEESFEREWQKTNQTFLQDNRRDLKGGKRHSLSPTQPPPSVYSLAGSPPSQVGGSSGFMQHIRRTFGLLHANQMDNLTKQEQQAAAAMSSPPEKSPWSQMSSSKQDGLNSNKKLFKKTEPKPISGNLKKPQSVTRMGSLPQRTDHSPNAKSSPDADNASANSNFEVGGSPEVARSTPTFDGFAGRGQDGDGSKMETQALMLRELDQIEVQIVKL